MPGPFGFMPIAADPSVSPDEVPILGALGNTWLGRLLTSPRTPGMAYGGGFGAQPSTPGQWSDEDEARAQINAGNLESRAGDLANLAVGGALPAVAARGIEGMASRPVFGSLAGAGALESGAAGVASKEPFYSAVQRAVENSPTSSASGSQWLGTIRNAPGVKPEEVERLHLDALLGRGNEPVSKDELLGQIEQNRTKLGEKELSGLNENDAYDQAYNEVAKTWPGIDDESDQFRELVIDRQNELMKSGNFPRYSEYQLPGGENYRERLLTLPTPKWYYPGRQDAPSPEAAAAIFRTSHWDDPNVVGHYRANDRTINGEPTMFLEELQSDWHQAGRRRGYRGTGDQTKDLSDADVRAFHDISENTWMDATPNERAQLRREAGGSEGGPGVPDAPFKKTWPDLLLKRAIREAVDNGQTQIAWTPGDVQAERYDLSKRVQRIDAGRNEDGTFDVTAVPHGGGNNISLGSSIPPEKLADSVGKDLADKIVKQPNSLHEYEGVDLKVGGEGMNAFYDQMLPQIANKIGKRYGAQVTRAPLSGDWHYAPREDAQGNAIQPPNVHVLKITPSLAKAAREGFPLYSGGAPVAGGDEENR